MKPLEILFRRERLIVGACLAAIVLLAWLYLLDGKATMPGMNMGMSGMDMSGMDMAHMAMPQAGQWGVTTVLLLFVMWAVMMVAMMVPSAAPMVLTFLAVNQRRQATSRPVVPVGFFLLGYLAVWTAYASAAAVAQWQLHRAALLSPAMSATSPWLSGGLLVAAGLFQWTPLKSACLKGCRSPLSFLMTEWREGTAGAFFMGLRHGAYCVGCCWILMALLFIAGVMNLLWVAAIALFVLAEKLLPKGEWFARVAGIVMVAAGVALMARLR
jgi:predicted metal-binding membrane protein